MVTECHEHFTYGIFNEGELEKNQEIIEASLGLNELLKGFHKLLSFFEVGL
jgi:hypothetical protein